MIFNFSSCVLRKSLCSPFICITAYLCKPTSSPGMMRNKGGWAAAGEPVWSCRELQRGRITKCVHRKEGSLWGYGWPLAQKYTSESPSSADWIQRAESAPLGLSAENRFSGNSITFISVSSSENQWLQTSSQGLMVPVKDAVVRNRIAPQSHGLSFLCDLVSAGLGYPHLLWVLSRLRGKIEFENGKRRWLKL